MTAYSMIEKLAHSLQSLRRHMPAVQVHIYSYTFDGTDHPTLDACAHMHNATVHHMGAFKAQAADASMSRSENLKHNILILKIDTVARHPADAVFVDVDTEWIRPLPDGILPASLHCRESYSLTGQVRSLAGVWSAIGREPPPASFCMWNSGFIRIPIADKSEVIAVAKDLVNDLAKQPGKHRLDNVLDEQLSLSYAMQLRYDAALGTGATFLKHHWREVHSGLQYWKGSL
jgi:hypothetical protein